MINIYLLEVNNVLLSQHKLKHIFWKSFKMNKYKINPLLIHVKKKNKQCMQIMLLFWVCQKHTHILNGIISLDIGKSDGNQMEIRQENVDF